MSSKQGAGVPRRRALFLATAVALLAAGCGTSSDSSSGGPVTVKAMDYFTAEPQRGAVDDLLRTCGRTTGVKVEHQSVANPQLMPKVLQQLSSHTLPDLLMLDNPALPQIAETGALTELSSAGVDLDGYYPSILSAGTYEKKVYGLAPGVNSVALFYNKDLLAAAHVEPPRTWAELTAAAKKLTKGDRYGFAMSADNDGEGAWQFLPFLWSRGGDLDTLDSAPSVAALDLVSGLVEQGLMSKSAVTWAQSDANDQFAAGKAAMMINGPWQFPGLDTKKDLKYGVAQIPVPTAGDTLKVPLGGEVWTVPRTDEAHQRAAAKVLACLNTPAHQLSFAKKVGYVPSRRAAAERLGDEDPRMAPFVSEVATAKSRTETVGTRYPAIATAVESALQSALSGAASPQEAMKSAQAKAGKSD
ncbi:ABC transporter substrate-binding protein [Streptomyces sp. GZWMJZ-114]|uniref:sugar ABC transporter substrate-binding protein n=1 Tax=Streptomyces sp. GZWMJZ-114 TaxID=2494734 RepID=UPI001013A748|nr:ABC transporter substrate-binding protein [Streptomyces sp. GZWMJZ-114]